MWARSAMGRRTPSSSAFTPTRGSRASARPTRCRPCCKAVFDAPLSNSIGRGLRDLLIGEDPLQIEPLWQRMMDGTLYLGTSGVRLTAISGAEMALWDIAGKASGRPVHELLGGAFHRRLRAYASVLFPDDPDDVEQVRENASRLRDAGFTAMKFGWGGFGRDRKQDVALVRAAREGAGADVGVDDRRRIVLGPDNVAGASAGTGRVRSLLAGSADAARAGVGLRRALRAQSDPDLLRERGRVLGEPALSPRWAPARHSAGRLERRRDRAVEARRSGGGDRGGLVRSPLLQHRHPHRGLAPPPGQSAGAAPDRVVDGGLTTQHVAGRAH